MGCRARATMQVLRSPLPPGDLSCFVNNPMARRDTRAKPNQFIAFSRCCITSRGLPAFAKGATFASASGVTAAKGPSGASQRGAAIGALSSAIEVRIRRFPHPVPCSQGTVWTNSHFDGAEAAGWRAVGAVWAVFVVIRLSLSHPSLLPRGHSDTNETRREVSKKYRIGAGSTQGTLYLKWLTISVRDFDGDAV